MNNLNSGLHQNTPQINAIDARGLTVRTVRYHRHPDASAITSERITRYGFDSRGLQDHIIDPRLYDLQQTDPTVNPNFSSVFSLSGTVLRTDSVDAGTTVSLNDVAGRPALEVNTGGVVRTWQYEDASLAGRLLSISEQVTNKEPRISEHFVWASNSPAERDRNLAGQWIRHYDPAGLREKDSLALTGEPVSFSRQLLKDTHEADWQGSDEVTWQALLAPEVFATHVTTDALGEQLTSLDARNNTQRVAYDIAGQLKGAWLTLKDENEQVIVQSLTYSSTGAKLHEVHGNGVITHYTYEPQTQFLANLKTERPSASKAVRILQHLAYEYDPVGNVVRVHDEAEETRFWRNQKVVPENFYTYDSLYQLVKATGREMANAGRKKWRSQALLAALPIDTNAYTNYIRNFTYDRSDNLCKIRHNAESSAHSFTTDITVSARTNRAVLSALTNAPDQVDIFFDNQGHQLQLLPGQHLTWNLRGQLKEVTGIGRDTQAPAIESYRYDTDSQRILKTSARHANSQIQRTIYLPLLELRNTTNHLQDEERLQIITVGNPGRAQVRILHWEMGKPDAINHNNQVRYSYDNLGGSSSLELDNQGNIISKEEYYPHGGTAILTARNEVEASYKTVKYSGKELDATGLYYFKYRYYQSWAGRWLSPDLLGAADGPNAYRMCRNNPITMSDPDGLLPEKRASEVHDTPPSEQTTVFNFIDNRQNYSDKFGIKQIIVANFTFPTPHVSETAMNYLKSSQPGNSFSGIMNINTGRIEVYPLHHIRTDANAQISLNDRWATAYAGNTHDSMQPITHNATSLDGKLQTSHAQTATKFNQKKVENIGFTFIDTTDMRNESDPILSIIGHRTSTLYGRSRTLNTPHFKQVDTEYVMIGGTSNESYIANKGVFTFELPIKLKQSIAKAVITAGESPFKNLLETELKTRVDLGGTPETPTSVQQTGRMRRRRAVY